MKLVKTPTAAQREQAIRQQYYAAGVAEGAKLMKDCLLKEIEERKNMELVAANSPML